jgi:predicted nucleic acid-binding protein
MLILVDSGILLRLVERNDPQHAAIRVAVRALRSGGDELVTAAQNAAEFWNACTRPATARGGYSLSIADADRRLRVIERLFHVLPDSPAGYQTWRGCSSPTRSRASRCTTPGLSRSCAFTASATS